MKQIFRFITCMAVCFLMCGLGSCSNQEKQEGAAQSKEEQLTLQELNDSITTLQSNVTELQEGSQSAHTIAWIIAAILIVVLVLAAIIVIKQHFGLEKKYSKLLRKVDEFNKKLNNGEGKGGQGTSQAGSKYGEKSSTTSKIDNLQESFESLNRRLQLTEQNYTRLVAELNQLRKPVQQTPTQTAANEARTGRHGYFNIPIEGADGAYFDRIAEERLNAFFEVECADNQATFTPIAQYSRLTENDSVVDLAVELQGDLDASQNYECIAPGRAHLQGGRWVIDAKAKLKLY